MHFRHRSTWLDQQIISFDCALRLFAGGEVPHSRPSPAKNIPEPVLSDQEKKLSSGLMRINHTGEVCAQALYKGQAMTSRSPHLQEFLCQAQVEEIDHLAWCADRLRKLGSQPSVLNPFWYVGSWVLGAFAGTLGDGWNLGFLAETERQVEAHLHEHMQFLPEVDQSSHAVLAQMRIDEAEHADMAEDHGAKVLPGWVSHLMRWTSNGMKTLVFYI